MWINTQPCILAVLIVATISIPAFSVGPSYSLALDTRHLLEGGSDGVRYNLQHWSNPEAAHFVPGLSFTEKFQLAVQNSWNRLAGLSSRLQPVQEPEPTTTAPGPSDFLSPLFNLVGEYSMDITIGTPPQRFSAIADTGSDLVWVQCQGCDYCQPQPDPSYDPSNSSTYKLMSCTDPLCSFSFDTCNKDPTRCNFEYSYGSGLIFGEMASETISLTTTEYATTEYDNFGFGCDYTTVFALADEVDGLVGLGQGPLSFTSQLGSLYGNKFSYCLVSIYDSNTTSSPLLFGDAAVPTVATQYTPIVENPNTTYFGSPTYYYIGLTGIKVDGVALDIPSGTFNISSDGSGGVISDSGTTIFYLATAAYGPLETKMQSLINYTLIPLNVSLDTLGLGLCYDLYNVSSPAFPTVTVVFQGFELDLPLENVFIGGLVLSNNPTYNSTYCMAIADSGFDFSIFGNIAQQNFQILYDRGAKQFGFAKVKCDRL